MATVSNCSKAAVKAAGTLGYILKQEQLDVIVQFALGKDVFAVLQQAMAKACVINACLKSSTRSIRQTLLL